MTRGSFIKSLAALFIAPKVLAEINLKSSSVSVTNANSRLFNDLNLLLPDYHKKCLQKYGNENYTLFLELLNNER